MKESIYQKLESKFSPITLEVIDDSHKHAGHHGMGDAPKNTHFTIKIVSDAFQGKTRVQCHQMVYGELQEEFDAGLHALAIRASAP